ncbi:hypothetical protein C0995_016662, partial [Termitomyces sp. Mi166
MAGMGDPIHQVDNAGVSPASRAGETLEVSVYKPPPKWDDSDPRNVSASFRMPGGLSISWMKPILNPGTQPEEKTFASGALPSLVYLKLPEHIGQRQRSLDSLPQVGEMAQSSAYVHSTPFRPPQTAPLQMEVVDKDQLLMHMMQYQTINPDWIRRDDNAASEVEQAPSAPPAR